MKMLQSGLSSISYEPGQKHHALIQLAPVQFYSTAIAQPLGALNTSGLNRVSGQVPVRVKSEGVCSLKQKRGLRRERREEREGRKTTCKNII